MPKKDKRPIKERAAEFGAHVLLIMHDHHEWNADVFEMIETIAADLDLGRPNQEFFTLPTATRLACQTITRSK